MPGTVLIARHTTVNITKIPALKDSILLSNEILHPLEKSKSKGYKVVNWRPYVSFSLDWKLDTLINIFTMEVQGHEIYSW